MGWIEVVADVGDNGKGGWVGRGWVTSAMSVVDETCVFACWMIRLCMFSARHVMFSFNSFRVPW